MVSLRRLLTVGLTLGLGVVVLALLLGSVLGQPVLLGYVETGSMQPTLDPNDGFIAVPAEVAGPIEEGDVITFDSQTLQGGGLTTHRVVGQTEQGFITRGDNNPFADQDGDEPPVRPAQVVAVAWQPGGSVVSLPTLGTITELPRDVLRTTQARLAQSLGIPELLGPQGLGYLVFGLCAVLYAVDLLVTGDTGKQRGRERDRDAGTSVRLIVAGFALVLVVSATAAMAFPGGNQQYNVISAEFESENPTVIRAGENSSLLYSTGNSGLVPAVSFVEPGSDSVSVDQRQLRLGPNAVANTSVTLSAPPETGVYQRYVTEHRYLRLLPVSIIESLYTVHPWLPIVAIDALLGGVVYLCGVRLAGTGRVRSRTRDNSSTLSRLWQRYL